MDIAGNLYAKFADVIESTKVNNVLFMTVLNHGYLLYIMNMLKSLKPWGLDKKILLVCLDEKAYTFLHNRGYCAIWADLNTDMTKFREFDSGKEYLTICFFKFFIILKMLELGHDVLFTDGDIVYINNPIEHLISFVKNYKDYDIYIQNDTQSNHASNNLCTGYFFARTNNITKKRFAITTHIQQTNFYSGTGDQHYLNMYMKHNLLFKTFPLETHPNGGFLYNNPTVKNNTDCILAHFNWIVGHIKISKMKEHSLWLLTDDEKNETGA